MNQYRQSYKDMNQNQCQRSFEFVEFPELKEYYSNQINSGYEKPKKIIVTEIYDESMPLNRKNIQRNEYFNYYTESKSPYHSNSAIQKIRQKRMFSQNKNMYLAGRNDIYDMYDMRMNNNSSVNGFMSDYNKQLYFGNTDLRNEYSSPSNCRVDIRKKVCRGSNTPQPSRNKFGMRGDEDFIENFQYYESKNIKDKSNKKYQSITRVTGYSNLIPLNNRRIEQNIEIRRNNLNNFNQIILSRNQNFNQQLRHNYSNVDVYKSNLKFLVNEKPKPQTPEKVTKIQIQKTTKNYEVQKKPQTTVNNNVVQTKISKRKYESTKIPQTTSTTTTTNITKKYEAIKAPTTLTTTNITKKYETLKAPKTVTTTNTTVKSSNYQSKKYEIAKPQISNITSKTSKVETVKTASSQAKTQKSNYIKTNIDLSKYNFASDKLYFKKSGGRYKYKENISDSEILNSRKNNISESKNIKKVEIIEKSKIEKKKSPLPNTSQLSISNINKSTSTKKTDTAEKTSLLASKYKISSNLNNKTNIKKTKETKIVKTTTTDTKKNISKPTVNNSYKVNITTTKTDIFSNTNSKNNKRKANTNISTSNNVNKNYQTNIRNIKNIQSEVVDSGLDMGKYRQKYINTETEIIANDMPTMSGQYLESIQSATKVVDTRNIGYFENKQVNEVNEMEEMKKKKMRHSSPKLKMKTKPLGDNYKYYESKFVQNPNENTTINTYTLHQRRNERIIYGNEVYVDKEGNEENEYKKAHKKKKSHKLKPGMKGYKAKSKKIVKKKILPMMGGDEGYIMYENYCEGNYNGSDNVEFENDVEENNFKQRVFYYQ